MCVITTNWVNKKSDWRHIVSKIIIFDPSPSQAGISLVTVLDQVDSYHVIQSVIDIFVICGSGPHFVHGHLGFITGWGVDWVPLPHVVNKEGIKRGEGKMEDGKFKIILLLVVWESYRNYLCVVEHGSGVWGRYVILQFFTSPLSTKVLNALHEAIQNSQSWPESWKYCIFFYQ